MSESVETDIYLLIDRVDTRVSGGQQGKTVRLTPALNESSSPTNLPTFTPVTVDIPRGIKAKDVTCFVEGKDFVEYPTGPINLALSLIGTTEQITAILLDKKQTPAYIAKLHAIATELKNSTKSLQDAKLGLHQDTLNGVMTALRASPTRARRLLDAEDAARRAGFNIENVLGELRAEGLISPIGYKACRYNVRLNQIKMELINLGFQQMWFV